MKNIVEYIRAARNQKKQCKELKTRLMADYVSPTPIPNIYKVVFEDDFYDSDKYNLYDTKENFYLFNRCKTTLQYLKYGLYLVGEYDKSGWVAGIFDVHSNWFVYAKKPSLKIKKLPNRKSDIVVLQTNNERIIFNLKTKTVESVINL